MGEQPTDDAQPRDGQPPQEGEPGSGEPQDAAAPNANDPNAAQPNANDPKAAQPNGAEPQEPGAAEQQDPQQGGQGNADQMPPNDQPQDGEQQSGSATPPPPNDMEKRALDVGGQSSTSSRKRLKIDEFAGSFDGQAREKLQLAINPVLKDLDEALAQAEAEVKPLVPLLEATQPWADEQSQAAERGDKHLGTAEELIAQLQKTSAGTPYAFIGLQLVDIAKSHVAPARDSLHAAAPKQPADKLSDIRTADHHLRRARELLAKLTRTYETVTRNEKIAEDMERIEKMHQVFLEDAFEMLGNQKPLLNPKDRKMAQLEYSEAYLKRLRELLEKKLKIQAELAKALAEDPRLLRRFMAQAQQETTTLRDQLTLLARRQTELHADVKTWTVNEAGEIVADGKPLAARQQREAAEVSDEASQMFDNYMTWMPLEVDPKSPEIEKFTAAAERVAQKGRDFAAAAQGADPAAGNDAGHALYDEANAFEQLLPDLAAGANPDLAVHAANRLIESRDLITSISGWIRKQEFIAEGDLHFAVDVEQYTLAADTARLATKLEALQELTIAMPREIGDKVRAFQSTLNDELIPEVMDAALPLEDKQPAEAAGRQAKCVETFARAEAELDDIMNGMIAFLDAQPLDDPQLADLGDVPTLEQLLAMLQDEQLAAEALGIPLRPTNLMMQGDWLRPGSGSMGGMPLGNPGDAAAMAAMQAQRARERTRRAAENMKRRVRDMSALPEAEQAKPGEVDPELLDWNRLGSKLEDSIRQGRDTMPPKQYRRAIEEYFKTIADGLPTEDEADSP